jgi:hypothetical protein
MLGSNVDDIDVLTQRVDSRPSNRHKVKSEMLDQTALATGEGLGLEAGFVAWRRGSSGWSRGADEDCSRSASEVIQAEPDPNVSGIAVALSGDTR